MSGISKKLMMASAGGDATGSYIAVGNVTTGAGSFVTMLDHTTPGSLSYITTYTLSGNSTEVDFSPDGNYVAVSNRSSPFFALLSWSGSTLSLAATYTLENIGLSCRFSPDGNYIAAGNQFSGDYGFTLLDHTTAGSLSLAATYALSFPWCNSVSWDPSGDYIAVADLNGLCVLLDHTTPGSVSFADSIAISGGNYLAEFSKDGDYILAGPANPPHISLVDHTTPGSLSIAATYALVNTANGASFSPDSDYAAIGHGSSPYFTMLDHTTPGSLSLATTYTLPNAGQKVDFSPDGLYIAVPHNNSPYFTLLDHSTPGSVSFAASYIGLSGAGGTAAKFSPN
jgi:WD40 repeat protein